MTVFSVTLSEHILQHRLCNVNFDWTSLQDLGLLNTGLNRRIFKLGHMVFTQIA